MSERFYLAERSYVVVTPPTPQPWPVVVMLHGAGGTADWTMYETRLGDEVFRGFLLVLPEATRPVPDQPPTFLSNPQVWNDGAEDGQPPRPTVDDVAFLDAVLDDVAARFAADAGRVFLMGFSNGAAMTFRYASERADRVAAIAPVAGYCNVEPMPSRPVSTVYLVGDADPLVPLNGGEIVTPWGRSKVRRPPVRETLAKWARAIGCSTTPTGDVYPGPVRFVALTLPGHGHHWPGGRGGLPERLAGPKSAWVVPGTNDELDFFEMLWGLLTEGGPQV